MKVKKTFAVLIVSMLSIVAYAAPKEAYAAPKEAWVASIYKGVVELKVQLGQQVKKGQLLFEVNQDILNIDKETNKKTVAFVKDVLKAGKKLIDKHSISQNDYQLSERDLKVSTAVLKTTESQIALSKYYAPFDGTVTKIVRYDGSGLGDNDNEVQITAGAVKVNTANQVALVCTRWPGVLDLKVAKGQKVKKGELLYTINTSNIKAQKGIAEAKAKYAKILYDRNKKLYGNTSSHATSLYKYTKSKNDWVKANAAVEKLKIQIKQSSGYAPFDGTVTKIYRYSGSGNGAGKPVVDITAL